MFGLLFCLLLALLTACGQNDELQGPMQDYADRLERVLGASWSALPPPRVVAYPRRRALSIEIPDQQISLLDYLNLLDCELNTLVAQRNSGIGRVMPASGRWAHERQFLILAKDCVRNLASRGKNDLAAQIETVMEAKAKNLPAVAWNALWAGPEFQQFLDPLGQGMSADFSIVGNDQVSPALQGLLALLAQSAAPQSDGPEADRVARLLEPIAAARAGQVFSQMDYADSSLRRLNQQLRTRLAARPLCPLGRSNERAQRLRTVLLQRFIGLLQPRLSELDRAWLAWAPLLTRLHHTFADSTAPQTVHAALQAYYTRYLQPGSSSLSARLRASMVEHARIWTELFHQCGIAVGNRP